MNYSAIRKTVGIILCIEAGFMLPPLVLALVEKDAVSARAFAIAIAVLAYPIIRWTLGAGYMGLYIAVLSGLLAGVLCWFLK